MADGVRVGAYPSGLVYAEGRVAAILDGADAHYLGRTDQVSAASERVVDVLLGLGLDASEDAAVGRCDLAADLRSEDGAEGLSVLRAAAHVDLPWLTASTDGVKRGRVGTVEWKSGRSIQLRAYDKGVESGTESPGKWLRLERQIRWRKTRELTVSSLVGLDLGGLFRRRYLEALANVREVVVCDKPGAVEHLRELHGQGAITSRELHLLAGFLAVGEVGLSRATTYKRWSRLRELGIALDLHRSGATVVSLASYARRAASVWEQAA